MRAAKECSPPVCHEKAGGLLSFRGGELVSVQPVVGCLVFTLRKRDQDECFDLTKHISDIIRDDSLNIDLGLVVTSNIDDDSLLSAFEKLSENSSYNYPRAATLNPLGTILLGSSPGENLSDKKVQLELTYSSY